MIYVRKEKERETEQIYSLIEKAFQREAAKGRKVLRLVESLKKDPCYIPELSLSAELDGALAGHALFAKIKIGDLSQLFLASLAVSPEYQKAGVGTLLVQTGHFIGESLGYDWSITGEKSDFYPRFGYLPADECGDFSLINEKTEAFMVCPLKEEPKAVYGRVFWPRPFLEYRES